MLNNGKREEKRHMLQNLQFFSATNFSGFKFTFSELSFLESLRRGLYAIKKLELMLTNNLFIGLCVSI